MVGSCIITYLLASFCAQTSRIRYKYSCILPDTTPVHLGLWECSKLRNCLIRQSSTRNSTPFFSPSALIAFLASISSLGMSALADVLPFFFGALTSNSAVSGAPTSIFLIMHFFPFQCPYCCLSDCLMYLHPILLHHSSLHHLDSSLCSPNK